MITKTQRRFGILLTVAFILLIPLAAMQFTKEVNWTLLDFATIAVLLLGAGFLGEVIMNMVTRTTYRVALLGALLILVALIWIELAVGIFGTPFAGS